MKKFFKLIKELKKTPRGKAILFFGFYLIFFLVIAILARTLPRDAGLNENVSEKEDNLTIKSINGYNYAYNYVINVDQNTFNFVGKKKGDQEEFIFNNINYYKNGTLYYINGVSTDSPNAYLELIDNIDLLMEYASYDSTVSYKSGKEVLRYQISSSTISNILDSKDLDIEEIPNEIRLTKNNDHIEEVEIILDSYCIALNKCIKNTSILISYSDFNNVGEITNN